MKSLFLIFGFLFILQFSFAQSIPIKVTDSVFKHSFFIGNGFEIKSNNCGDMILNTGIRNLVYAQKDSLQVKCDLSNSDLLSLDCTYPVDSLFWIKLYSALSQKENLDRKICVITVFTGGVKNIKISYLRLYSKKAYEHYLKRVAKIRVYVDDITGEVKYGKLKSLFKNASTYIVVSTSNSLDLINCKKL